MIYEVLAIPPAVQKKALQACKGLLAVSQAPHRSAGTAGLQKNLWSISIDDL